MIPVVPTDEHRAFWRALDGCDQQAVVVGGPAEGPDVMPCPALVALETNCVHVAYRLDEIELAHLARGGTLWLTTWGMIPVHLVSVQPPDVVLPAGDR